MEFKLTSKEVEKVEKIKESLINIYGKEGDIVYTFHPTGIGIVVYLYSKLANQEINITDYESW